MNVKMLSRTGKLPGVIQAATVVENLFAVNGRTQRQSMLPVKANIMKIRFGRNNSDESK